jgi:hypothetical protein
MVPAMIIRLSRYGWMTERDWPELLHWILVSDQGCVRTLCGSPFRTAGTDGVVRLRQEIEQMPKCRRCVALMKPGTVASDGSVVQFPERLAR